MTHYCGCLCQEIHFRIKKGRGQRKNRRDKESRLCHHEEIILATYSRWRVKRGMTQKQIWDEMKAE